MKYVGKQIAFKKCAAIGDQSKHCNNNWYLTTD